jgi:hypothetical protein
MDIEEDGSLKNHESERQIKSVVDSLTQQIGGGAADIDANLETLRFMKMMLKDVGAVEVGRSRHDQGFLEMLLKDKRLRRLAGFDVFDGFNRQMTVEVGQHQRRLTIMPYSMHYFEVMSLRPSCGRITEDEKALGDAALAGLGRGAHVPGKSER